MVCQSVLFKYLSYIHVFHSCILSSAQLAPNFSFVRLIDSESPSLSGNNNIPFVHGGPSLFNPSLKQDPLLTFALGTRPAKKINCASSKCHLISLDSNQHFRAVASIPPPCRPPLTAWRLLRLVHDQFHRFDLNVRRVHLWERWNTCLSETTSPSSWVLSAFSSNYVICRYMKCFISILYSHNGFTYKNGDLYLFIHHFISTY